MKKIFYDSADVALTELSRAGVSPEQFDRANGEWALETSVEYNLSSGQSFPIGSLLTLHQVINQASSSGGSLKVVSVVLSDRAAAISTGKICYEILHGSSGFAEYSPGFSTPILETHSVESYSMGIDWCRR